MTAIITKKYDKAYEQTMRQNWTHMLRDIFISVVLGNGLSSPQKSCRNMASTGYIHKAYTFLKWKRCWSEAASIFSKFYPYRMRVRECDNTNFYPLITSSGGVEITQIITQRDAPKAFPVLCHASLKNRKKKQSQRLAHLKKKLNF